MAAASQPQDRPESDVDEEFIDYESEPEPSPASQHNRAVPALFTTPPPVRDALPTATSKLQDDTLRQCLPFLAADPGSTAANPARNAHGVPALLRDNHVKFLEKQLGRFPAPYVAADASRPWFLYWSLNALALLGYDTAVYRDDLIATVRTMQNLPGGGFGGGHGQNSHLATTYAVVLALAIVGGEDAYEVIDRRAMWRWICSLKQRDGGIQMTLGGEVDVRYLDVPRLISWLSSRQYAPEGGFSGRTNKLVDGCYSHWVGGCWPLIDAVLKGASELEEEETAAADQQQKQQQSRTTPAEGSLYSREGLIRYILCCGQDCSKRGGLRDKPSNSAQHRWDLTYVNEDETILPEPKWVVSPCAEGAQIFDEEDRVGTIHPVYTIPQESVNDMKAYFAARQGF
ncbi:CAAX farnesyltransferase (FTase) subunit beta [Colletotrichum tropicale]|nr:CAAX farnesyltransferase (FTase) subunit beta [Colletotrichum tropicale]